MPTARRTVRDKHNLERFVLNKRINRLQGAANRFLPRIEDGVDTRALCNDLLESVLPQAHRDLLKQITDYFGLTAGQIVVTHYKTLRFRFPSGHYLQFYERVMPLPKELNDAPMPVPVEFPDYAKFERYTMEQYTNMEMYVIASSAFRRLNESCSSVGQLQRVAPFLFRYLDDSLQESMQGAERRPRWPSGLPKEADFRGPLEKLHTALAVSSLLPETTRGWPLMSVGLRDTVLQ